MHPLDSPRLKVRRAKLHLDALQRSIGRFLERDPYTISPHETRENTEYTIQRQGTLPKTWGLLAGDFAHNLRSSLDHIAYEFNIRNRNPVPETSCQFPIFDTSVGYRSRGKRMFPSKPSGVKRIIENLQPYHRRKRPELRLLSLLRDLDNADKHRTITPIFDHTQFQLSEQFSSPDFGGDFTFDLDHGGYRVILTPRVRERIGDKLNPQLAAQIVFDVAERGTGTVHRIGMPTLQAIYVLVCDHIIPQFSNFFIKVQGGWITEWRTSPINRH